MKSENRLRNKHVRKLQSDLGISDKTGTMENHPVEVGLEKRSSSEDSESDLSPFDDEELFDVLLKRWNKFLELIDLKHHFRKIAPDEQGIYAISLCCAISVPRNLTDSWNVTFKAYFYSILIQK